MAEKKVNKRLLKSILVDVECVDRIVKQYLASGDSIHNLWAAEGDLFDAVEKINKCLKDHRKNYPRNFIRKAPI